MLVIEEVASYDMIAKYFAEIENIMGRKMRGLEVQLASDFVTQAAKVVA